MCILGATKRRREHIGDRREKETVLGCQRATRTGRQRTKRVLSSDQSCDDELIGLGARAKPQLPFDSSRCRWVARYGPRSPQAVDTPEPERRVRAMELTRYSRKDSGHNVANRVTGGE